VSAGPPRQPPPSRLHATPEPSAVSQGEMAGWSMAPPGRSSSCRWHEDRPPDRRDRRTGEAKPAAPLPQPGTVAKQRNARLCTTSVRASGRARRRSGSCRPDRASGLQERPSWSPWLRPRIPPGRIRTFPPRRVDSSLTAQPTIKCSLGLHRWTTDGGPVLTCFRCGKQRPIGKALRCRIGMHRWGVKPAEGGGQYRECLFCRMYGGTPPDPPLGEGGL
jgi:hypothetical protein